GGGILSCSPMARAAAFISLDGVSAFGLVGLMSSAMMVAIGTRSCSSASRFGPTSTPKLDTPVRLPPGRLRLATSPAWTASAATLKTIGIVEVAALASRTAGPFAKITATPGRAKAAAQVGRHNRQSFIVSLGPAVFDKHVTTFDVPGLAQTLAESGGPFRIFPGRRTIEKSNHRHSRLLRPRHHRPRRRAPKPRDAL